jgi:flagellar biosynthesis chaperone FliJ
VTYPKDGERKLRESVKQLKTQVSRLRKENSMLRQELNNIMKPVRPRKEHLEEKSKQVMTRDEWRQEFIKKFKPSLDKRLKEVDEEKEES